MVDEMRSYGIEREVEEGVDAIGDEGTEVILVLSTALIKLEMETLSRLRLWWW